MDPLQALLVELQIQLIRREGAAFKLIMLSFMGSPKVHAARREYQQAQQKALAISNRLLQAMA